MPATIDYSSLPYTGHSGVTINDHLRGRFALTPRLSQIRQRQEAVQLQKQEFAQKREEAEQQLQSARAQIAAIAAAQAQAQATPAPDSIVPETTTTTNPISGWRKLLSR